jgi:CheY-like chemotaxis protein
MKKKKLLLVEDDELMRTLYLDILTEKFEVDIAVDGEDAYHKIQVNYVDIILMDMLLPKMNGLEVVERVKKENPKALKGEIIFLTNMDKASLGEVEKKGYSYVIKSELSPDKFLQKILELTSKK